MDPKDPRKRGAALPPEEALRRLDPDRDFGGKSVEDFIQEESIANWLSQSQQSGPPEVNPDTASSEAAPRKTAFRMLESHRSRERRRYAVLLRHAGLDGNGRRKKPGGASQPLVTDPPLLPGDYSRPPRRVRPKNSERRQLLDELLREGRERDFAERLLTFCRSPRRVEKTISSSC
jgi:hypothetical protein